MAAPSRPTLTSYQPRIGVSLCLDRGERIQAGKDYWYVHRAYTRRLREAGAVPLLIGPDVPVDACAELCDGVLLSGGGNLPHRLQAGTLSTAWPTPKDRYPEERERILWELELLRSCMRTRTPVLGVCFGMQLMNLAHGGSLGTVPEDEAHGSVSDPCEHSLRIDRSSKLLGSLGGKVAAVCSAHRQCVAEVGAGLRAVAWSPGGVVEAIEGEGLFGVEWHPESDGTGSLVYARFTQIASEEHFASR